MPRPRAGATGGVGALALLTAAALLLGAALSLQAYREARHPLPPASSDVLYFRGGAAVSRAALGFDAILADVYWIRAIQHFGGTRRSQERRQVLQPAVPAARSDDDARPPLQHRLPLRRHLPLRAAIPQDPGRTDQAIALLERGLAADPKRWQYAQDAGFVHYWWRQDYKAAAEWFDRASRIEGAPWWLRSMAATTLAEGGDRQSSRQLWQQLYETTDDEWVRNNAQLKLAQLERSTRSTRWPRSSGASPRRGHGLRPTGTNWSRCAGSRASRSTRRARRTSSSRTPRAGWRCRETVEPLSLAAAVH